MGLSDPPKQLNLTDIYPEGSAFLIRSAWVEGVVKTQFGDRTMAKAIVEPVGGGQGQEFALWGSLCEQIQQIEEGDIPGVYKVVKDGKRWLFAPAGDDVAAGGGAAGEPAPEGGTAAVEGSAAGEVATPAEQELGVEPGPGEGAAPQS